MNVPLEQLIQHDKDARAAQKLVDAKHEANNAFEQEWADCMRTFTPEQADAAISALPDDEKREAQTASIKARTIAPPSTFADKLAAIKDTTAVESLTDSQFDKLWDSF
jgi:hypothetical protein